MLTNTRTVLTFAALLSTISVGCAGYDADDFSDSEFAADDDSDSDSDGAAEGGGERDGGAGCSDRDIASLDPHCDPDPTEPARPTEPTEPGDGGMCEPHETDLIAGKHTDTGSVSVSNDSDELSISVDAAAPYLLTEVHIYVGSEEVPVGDGGNPAPGQFPYVVELDEPTASYELAIALEDLAVGCDDSLNVAVHAVVVSFDGQGNEVFEETAWGFGDEEFGGSRWGWSFDYGICCEVPEQGEGEGCTLTRGYWQTHNSEAEVPALQESWPIPEGTDLCGMTWLEILNTEPNGDAFIILASQWIAAQLNIANGASSTPEIDAMMANAEMYFGACEVLDHERDDALATASMLDAYNNGEVGPGHCE